MPSGASKGIEAWPQLGHAASERRGLAKGFYFCLVQFVPSPSCFVFTEPGEYTIGCSCAINACGTLVTIPLGPSAECRGRCCYLRVSVRERIISVRQHPQTTRFSGRGKENQQKAFAFVKEATGKGLEFFTQLESAENCTFRLTRACGVNASSQSFEDFPLCSFSFRRVLLGVGHPVSPRVSESRMDSDGSRTNSEASLSTDYEASVLRHFEVFPDMRIGKGGNGEVFLGLRRSQGDIVAVKREPKDMLRHEFSLITDIRLDGPLLTYKAQDPHPSKFLGLVAHSVAIEVGNSAVASAIAHHSAPDDEHDYLVLEMVAGGELRKLVKTNFPSGMSLDMARVYIYQIICGLVLIHSKHIIHRDLKTQNILVRHGETFRGDELKIIDFGNSAKVKPGSIFMKNYTTCFACAPEQFSLTGKGYSYGIDIWAVGTIFFELLSGERLFDCLNIAEASRQIPAFKERHVKERLPHLRHDARDFLLKCLTKDPEKRPTALQLLTTPFLFPMHIYQIRRRIETTDVFNSYMKAFEKGWGNLQPIESLSMMEDMFYDSHGRSFCSRHQGSEVVNVVLPVFECVPDFQSQDRGIRIHNWILDSDASFRMAPTKVDRPEDGISASHACGAGAPSKSTSKNKWGFASSSRNLGESCSNPALNKLLSESQLLHSKSSVPKGGQAPPQCSLTCSTASMGSPVPPSLFHGGAD